MVGDPGGPIPNKLAHLSKIKLNIWLRKKLIKKNNLKIKGIKSK